MLLSLFVFTPHGYHRAAWRHPDAVGQEIYDLDFYFDLVERAESARFDLLFLADELSIWDRFETGLSHFANSRLEPLTLLSALAARTRDLGLVATSSTTFNEPFTTARMFASLDFLSRGRAVWNVVTTSIDEAARNYGGSAIPGHADRYGRAEEFVDVVKGLWDSWEDGAIVLDRASGFFADPRRVHRLNHQGPHFKVQGPLNVHRPPQGHPIVAQAGTSEAGKELCARTADIQFTAFKTLEEAIAHRKDMDEHLLRHGRQPRELKILAGMVPMLANSEQAILERSEALQALVDDRFAVDLVSRWIGLDLTRHGLDEVLPELPDLARFDGTRTTLSLIARSRPDAPVTVREFARSVASDGFMPIFRGTASDIADEMRAWLDSGAVDGFNLMIQLLPQDFEGIVDELVPELQRRGLHPTSYSPGTLRDRLGLERPPNRFALRTPSKA